MQSVIHPWEIFDREEVLKKIGRAADPEKLREKTLPVIREAYAQGRAVIRRRFLAEERGAVAVNEGAFLIDGIIRALHDVALPYHTKNGHAKNEPVVVVAVGGYGRSELFPFSDIDLLFLHDGKKKVAGVFAEWILYALWDLGVTVGHSVRTVAETLEQAAGDATICTNLLDARFLCGDKKLFDSFDRRFESYIKAQNPGDFIDAKLAERDRRHQKSGDSRYVLEPNLKEGKGGLRDLQTLLWLARYIYDARSPQDLVKLHLLLPEEFKSFQMARDFLWRVRVHLHLAAGRAEERLTFDFQRAVAEAMGYFDDGTARAVERFMKDYFLVARDVGNLTRSVCAVLEEDKKRKPRVAPGLRLAEASLGDFHLEGERLAVNGADAFKKKPLLLITLFAVAHENGIDIHPRTLQLVQRNLSLVDGRLRGDEEANDAFMQILLSKNNPEPTLRRMSDAGMLGRFLPDFGRVIGQMQFDMYHVFTVDEHTLFAIGILHGIASGKYAVDMPITTHIYPLIQSHRVLYLSLLAHDIAKGRGGDHSLLGEVVVRKLARRFRFTAHETETCAWLVRQHLLMSRTAFKRDLSDPKAIEDFVAKVQSPERLRLLLVLTVADIRAVGPTVWNGWKGQLLRDLYNRAEEKMGGSDVGVRQNEEAALRKELAGLLPGWKPQAIATYLEQGGASFAGCDAPTHARIATLLREMVDSGQKLVLSTRSDSFRAMTEVIVCTEDSQGLFSRITGAMALAGANIASAKIFTLASGTAVEIFHIQDVQNQAFDKPDKIARMSVLVNKAVAGELDIVREIAAQHLTYPTRMDVFKVPPRVLIENKVSANNTVIEVSARDRVGFLHAVTNTLARLGLTISTAHISTYGERAADVFYVRDTFGMKVHHESRIQQIHDALIETLSAPQEKVKQTG